VRQLFAKTTDAQQRGFTASRFSFTVDGGHCPTCKGEGFISIELIFMPDNYSHCPTGDGSRSNPETLEVQFDVGLEYLTLGQPATELSGGEAPRIKIATEPQRPTPADLLRHPDSVTAPYLARAIG